MFAGIDVSKDCLDVHLLPGGESFSVARNDEGLTALCARFETSPPELIVLEATGGFETVVASALAAARLPLAVVNPRQIRDFARATGRVRLEYLGRSVGRVCQCSYRTNRTGNSFLGE